MMLAAAAIMAKPMAVTLPLVLLLMDIYPLKRIVVSAGVRRNLRLLIEKNPFFFLSAVSIILTSLAQHAGGAFKTLERIPLHSRLLNALHSLFFYLAKMLWPVKLVPFYPFPTTIHFFDLTYGISAVLVFSINTGCMWLWKRGNYLPATAWAYYIITLVPVVGIVQVGGQAAADRYTYLPSLSIFLLAGLGFAHMVVGRDLRKRVVIAGGLLTAIIFILFAQLTLHQVKIWQDSETLWKYFITSFPGRMYRAHYDLGNIYYERGMFYEAITEYENAIAIHPNFPEAHNNLGNAYYKINNYSDAANHFEKALALGHKVDLGLLEFVKHNQPYF
jgi:tetratricopeptide (TPR) repeat protein